MTTLRPSLELCSLSVLGDLIQLDERSALRIFSQLCGMDHEMGRFAIRSFQSKIADDARWLEALAQVDDQAVLGNPRAVLTLLTEGFGLYELDAMDVVIRLSRLAEGGPTHIAESDYRLS